jgi:hypothetical protein
VTSMYVYPLGIEHKYVKTLDLSVLTFMEQGY